MGLATSLKSDDPARVNRLDSVIMSNARAIQEDYFRLFDNRKNLNLHFKKYDDEKMDRKLTH
jgi:hypothetical protein